MPPLPKGVGFAGQRPPYFIAMGALAPCKAFATEPPFSFAALVVQPGRSDEMNHGTPSAPASHTIWQATGRPTLVQLDEAFQLYRRIMRANRRALPKLSIRRLADAFVKNEFRLHMASASASLRGREHPHPYITSTEPREAGSGTATDYSRQYIVEDIQTKEDGDTPGCSEEQFRQFLAAWDEYLSHAVSTAAPLQMGRTLKPSQRKLLNDQQMAQLRKLKNMACPSAPS